MLLFLDTANLDSIKKYAALGIVDGVTTNPTLVAKEGVNFETRIKEIAEVITGSISTEVLGTEYEEMVKEGRVYAKWAKNVYVKIPMTANGLRACKTLSTEGIPINVTLIFSAAQALLAVKAGATFVSPFIGRLDDVGEDGMNLIGEILDIFENYDFKAKVLVASIRHPRHVIDAAKMGAHIATMPAEVMEKLLHHPLTDKGLATFLEDAKKIK